jgi:hypothetical protein
LVSANFFISNIAGKTLPRMKESLDAERMTKCGEL